MNKHELTLNGITEIDLSGTPILHGLAAVDFVVEEDKLYATWPDFNLDAVVEWRAGEKLPKDMSALSEGEQEDWESEYDSVDVSLARLRLSVTDASTSAEEFYEDQISIPYMFKIAGVDYELVAGYAVHW